jgi:hypothetical protein
MKQKPQKSRVVQLTRGPIETYGIKFDHQFGNQLDVELIFLKCPTGSLFGWKGDKNPQGKPAWIHFVNAVNLIWNYPGSRTPFMWHPWAIKMAKAAFENKRLAISSGGSGGKTGLFAVYCLVWWLANPYKNVVLVNTTTIKDSMGRIWGQITRYFNGMAGAPPGKLVESSHCIKSMDLNTGVVMDEYGIRLFPGEQSKAAESSRAIRGQKHGPGGKLIVVLDECAELSPSIINTFEENLTQNPNVQLIALANANSPFDTFGQLCEPIPGGWDSYNPDWDEWKGKGAHVIRINNETSPNIIEGKVIYPFLMTREMLEEKREKLGQHTRAYWRGVLGAFLLDGDDDNIYSASEVLQIPPDCVWQGIPTKVAGFDIAHTVGGDKSVLMIGSIGVCTDGKKRLKFEKSYYLNEDLSKKDIDRTTQMVSQLKDICQKEGVKIENLAIDSSAGGGKTFSDAIWSQWSNGFLRVDFGGRPSDRPVSSADREKSSVRFHNKVSEIWGIGKELLRCDQLRCIPKGMAEDMTARKYKDNKAQDGGSKIRVESKIEMKRRTGKSPDEGDSGFILIDLCRERHGLSGLDKPGNHTPGKPNPLQKRFKQLAGLWAS